jgi:lambda family phage portal protein
LNISFQIGKRSFAFGTSKQIPDKTRSGFGRRNFDASVMDRLTADWLGGNTSADAENGPNIRTLRERARDLSRNDPYVQRYLILLENNVLGANGVASQFKAKDPNGILDRLGNDAVKKGWEDWKRRENCTMSKTMCFRDVEAMVLRSSAIDGGILVRKVPAKNNYGISLQPLEIDFLDLDYTGRYTNGNEVRFGVEFNDWREPIALHILTAHPGDAFQTGGRPHRRRVEASEILHIYWPERPDQTVGIPWITCVMRTLRDLGKYREAEIIAARVSACKGFAITPATPEGYNGAEDDDGNIDQSMEPGQGIMLNPGDTFTEIDPTHPNTAFGPFSKDMLRAIAAGLGVNYNSLANDLESVNYSSMRAGKLEEVEEYKAIQSWLIESLHQPIFEAWLESALMAGALKLPNGSALPVYKFDKLNAVEWKPRRWPWVDPLKDLQAAVLKVEKGFGSRRSIIAEMGEDIETVFADQKADNELAQVNGLEFPLDNPLPAEPVVDSPKKVDVQND